MCQSPAGDIPHRYFPCQWSVPYGTWTEPDSRDSVHRWDRLRVRSPDLSLSGPKFRDGDQKRSTNKLCSVNLKIPKSIE